MKYLLLLFAGAVSAGSLRTSDAQQHLNANAPRNYILNSGAEKNTLNVTDASAIVTRSTSSPMIGDASFVIDATATSQLAVFQASDLQGGLLGQSCEWQANIIGDASLYTMYATLAGNTVSDVITGINSGTNSQPYSLIFPCGASTTDDPAFVIASTGNAASIKVDGIYLGRVLSLGTTAQAYDFGSATYAATASCEWSNTTESTTTPAAFPVDSDCPTPTLTGRVTAPATKLPGFNIPAGSPSGTYAVTATGAFRTNRAATSGRSIISLFGNSVHNNIQYFGGSIGSATSANFDHGNLVFSIAHTASSTDTLYELRGAGTAASPTTSIITDVNPLEFNITYFPSSSQITVRGDTTDLGGIAFSAATTSCAWSTTSATMAAFGVDADCTVPTVSGNATAPATKIPAFIAPSLRAGRYRVDAFSRIYGSQSSSGSQTCTYEIWDGTTSGGKVGSGTQLNTGSSPASVAGVFTYSSNKTNVQFEIRAERTSGNGTCFIDAGPSSDLTFLLTPLTQAMPAPFIPSSVFSGFTGIEKVYSGELNCDASSTFNRGGSGLTAGNRSTTSCGITVESGGFSAQPWSCSVTVKSATVQAMGCVCSSATSCTVYGPNADYDAFITIRGPK